MSGTRMLADRPISFGTLLGADNNTHRAGIFLFLSNLIISNIAVQSNISHPLIPSCLLQDMLFKRIQDGQFSFPDQDWANISDNAKDLIRHLLQRDPRKRYSAQQVLDHDWIVDPTPDVVPARPRMISR